MLAIMMDHADITQQLLAKGAEVNAKDGGGNTALMLADKACQENENIVRLLLAKGARISRNDWYNSSAIKNALELISRSLEGELSGVQAALANGAEVNAQDEDGTSALMAAAAKGYTKIVQELLAKGADVNAQDEDGYTALMWAAWNDDIEIVSTLLAKGAAVNAKDGGGNTALMLAADNDHLEIVSALLAAGADVNAQDKDGHTALMFAAWKGHTEIAQLLKAYGAGRSWMLRGGLILLGAGLVGVGLMFGLGYVLPALSFGIKLTVSIASASTVLLLGYGIDHSTQAAHKAFVIGQYNGLSSSDISGSKLESSRFEGSPMIKPGSTPGVGPGK